MMSLDLRGKARFALVVFAVVVGTVRSVERVRKGGDIDEISTVTLRQNNNCIFSSIRLLMC